MKSFVRTRFDFRCLVLIIFIAVTSNRLPPNENKQQQNGMRRFFSCGLLASPPCVLSVVTEQIQFTFLHRSCVNLVRCKAKSRNHSKIQSRLKSCNYRLVRFEQLNNLQFRIYFYHLYIYICVFSFWFVLSNGKNDHWPII